MDYSGILTIATFTLFFIIVALNWITYYIMVYKGEAHLATMADNLFYIGEYLSWFLIMFVQIYYTFEMYLVR